MLWPHGSSSAWWSSAHSLGSYTTCVRAPWGRLTPEGCIRVRVWVPSTRPGAGRGLALTLAEPETFPAVQILIRNRATDLDARMHDGTTPLILAARLAVEGMLEDLINSHADVNAVDDLGEPSWAGPREGARHADCRPLTCLPTPDAPSSPLTGKSALHWAAAVNNVEAAVVLLKNGANKDMQNNKVGWLARYFPSPAPFCLGDPRAITSASGPWLPNP